MREIEKNIDCLLSKAVSDGIFPSYAAGILLYKNKGREICLLQSNRKNQPLGNIAEEAKQYFDLASLTKPLATALSIISLLGEGRISLAGRLTEYLPAALPEDKAELSSLSARTKLIPSGCKCDITIAQLLNHSSGLPAHRPYYQQLATLPVAARKAELLRLICAEQLVAPPGTVAIYSDLGYLLLGLIIEGVAGVGLEEYFAEKIAGPLGLAEGIFYNPPGNLKKPRQAFFPTENCPWRGKVLQGEVSDENCWALGGVAGHAGLFGNLESVLGLTAAILEIWQGRRVHPHLRREDLTLFLEARSQVPGSTWALGFDRPTPGSSSSGRYLSPRSVGHLGFTGTSFWIDPNKELVVVLLTNRVHPSRDNNLIRDFRPYFHDRVFELLGLV